MSKSAVGVVARIVAKPESVEIVREGLRSLLEPTRAEAGCIIYELMQNTADPADFTFYEEWTDEASLNAHSASAHLKTTFQRLEGHLAGGRDVRRYSFIDL
jgi:quinol monooxygenase YgiN